MSVFGGIIRAAGGGATSDPVSDPRLWTGLSIGGRQTTAGEWIDGETALTLPGYYAAIRNISEDIGKISLKILRRDGENKVEDRVHPLWTLLHDDPNPEMSSMGFRETLTQWALSWGNGYAEIVRNGAGVPVALYPLHPSRVRFKRRQNGDPYYEVRADDALKRLGVSTFNAVTIEPSGMFHVRGLGTGNEGYSAFRLMAETLGRAMAIRKFGSAFFANGLNAQVMLEHPTVLGDDAIRHLRESLASQHGGSENAHGVFIAEEGMKIQKISVPPEEAQAIEQEQFLLEDVCRVLRMPPHKVQNLARSTFCLPGDAMVFTESGPKPIAEVEVGELVWSRGESGWVRSRVAASACTGFDDVLEIKAGIRTLRCNARHRLPVRRQSLRPFSGGRGRCVVIDGRRYRKTWAVEWVEAGEIKPGDQLLAASGFGGDGSRSCPTREECSVEFMESLGMIVGDGFFARTGRGRYRYKSVVGLSHGENDSYLPHYVSTIESEFRSCDGPYGLRNGGTKPLVAKRRDKNTTVFHSSPMYAELDACGIAGTAKTKRLPGWMFCLSDDLKLAFLRGYLDADGTVNKNGQIRYVSVNRTLLDQVRHLCMSVGIRCGNLCSSEIDSDFGGGRMYRHVLYHFICTDARQNARIGTHTDFYQERIRDRIATRPVRTCNVYPNEAARRAVDAGVIFTTVESVRVEPERVAVYDLNVEGTHTFVADGVLVHNSNIEHQSIEYVVDTIFPWVRRWEDEIRRKLFVGSSRTTHFAEFALESLLRADSKARAEFYALMQSWGNYTINDVLRKENLPTAGPSGDVRLVPMNMTTLDRLIEGPPPPKPSPEPKPEQKPEPKRERDREAATMSGTRMFSAVIDRCSAKRTKAATAAATKHAGDGPAFGAWCDKFLAQHDEEMVASLIPVAEGFAMLIGAADPAQLIGRYSVGVCAGFGQVLKAAHEEGAVPLACEAWRTPEYAVNEGAKIAAAIVAAAGDDQ